MRLCVPIRQVPDKAFAVGPGLVGFWSIFGFGAAEDRSPFRPRRKPIRMIYGMAAFMAQQLEAPLRSPALHFEHLVQFERLQTRMRQIERNGDGGEARRRKTIRPPIA